MIKAIIFDVGGVLLRTEDLSPREKWAKRYGMGVWDFASAVFDSDEANRATVGLATEGEAWLAAQQRFNVPQAEMDQFRIDFFAGDRWDESLLDWIISLRGRYRTAILSNAWGGARKFLMSHTKVMAAFEQLIISAEEGVRKPQGEIYRRAVQRLSVLPHEAVFVDDVLENVEAAKQVGLEAVQFNVGVDVRGWLKGLDVF
ncbi:MAG: HAD family phosphatase [Chloroflexota bacterium]